MEIQQAIEHARKVAGEKYTEGMLCHANPDDGELDKCIECAKEHEQFAEWLEEFQQYRVIGTVEECRKAREKQRAKKPMNIRLLETSGVHCGTCPICKKPVYVYLKNQNHREYCGHCGQAIDWGGGDTD